MSDEALEAWRHRLALVRQALKKSAPTGGGGAPADTPVKPPDARGAVNATAATPGAVFSAPVVIPEKSAVSPKTFSLKTLKREERARRRGAAAAAAHEVEQLEPVERPKVRGDCEGGNRPCPYVGCRHHTYLDVSDKGSLKLNHPDKEPEQLSASCSLDVADDGPKTLEQVGAVLNLTRERMRQIEQKALVNTERAFAPDEVKQFRGSCKARCANTGLLCRLPAHNANVPHSSERGAFYQVAVEGQTTFPRREELDRAARRVPEEEASHVRS